MKSIVEQRVAFLIGRNVIVRVTWASELLRGELVALLPLGRDYHLHLVIDGRARLISTRGVLELAEAQ